MNSGVKVPHELQREQQWFGSIISRPIDENSRMNPISPSGRSMEIEACEHILPSPTMQPAERIQVYNQQYWWRLLNTLHDIFPLVTRLFGYFDFNQTIGIPYLTKYYSRHWSLNLLGDRMVQWLEEEYHGDDKGLVVDSAKIDWAFSESFLARNLVPLTLEQLPNESAMEEILEKPLYAQPHIQLFKLPYHLFDYRNEFLLNDPDYWMDHEFPLLKKEKTYYFVLYRNANNDISWKEITGGEYHLLGFFKQGMSIGDACDWLEKQEEAFYQEAVAHLQKWFQEWTHRGWLSLNEADGI